MNIGHVKARQRHTVQMSIKGIPLPYACKSSLASPTLVLPLLMFSLYPHLPIMSSPLTLHVAKALPKSPLQSHSTGSFRCLHYILWPPWRADSTETPLVCFSLACGNVPRTAVSFGNSLVYPPSFLALFTYAINLSFSHLPHRRQIDTYKETADISGGRRQHEEHSISRKVDIEGPQRINIEAYINQTNTPCPLLPPLAIPIQRILSFKPVWDVARRGDPWGISFPSFSNLIFMFIFLYLISFLFFSFLLFSSLFFSFLLFSSLFFSFLFIYFD